MLRSSLFLLLGLALLGGVPSTAQTVAWRGADLHTVSGDVIEDGVLVATDGVITALGDAGTAIPAGAEVVAVDDLRIYPGVVQAWSNLGLSDIDSVRGSVDLGEMGDNNADLRAEIAVNADNIRLLPALGGGVTFAHVVPQGGVVTGRTAVMRLDGWNWEDMTVRAPEGLFVRFPDIPEGGGEEAVESKALEAFDEMFDLARRYGDARAGGAEIATDRKLEPLVAVLDGELRLLLQARSREQISAALAWVEERGIEDVVLFTGPDAVYVADELAAKDVPVVLRGVLSVPGRDMEAYDFSYSAPARLAEAGVRFALAGQEDSAFARNLPIIAGMATAHGLDRDTALRSITLTAAQILGVEERIGSLEVGKEATFFVTDGDPLEVLTSIEHVVVSGIEVDLGRDRQRQLWERYRNRPTP